VLLLELAALALAVRLLVLGALTGFL
jgi:hypothetical protein